MRLFLAVVLFLAPWPVLAAPALTLSVYQIESGDAITMQATGFAPGAKLVSHLFRPDGTEYPVMSFDADAQGRLSHVITIVPVMFGTYEVRLVEEGSRAGASARFVMVAPEWPAFPKTSADSTPAGAVGVWQGTAVTQSGESAVLVAVTGGRLGTVVGTVSYPARLCGGELWLINVQPDTIHLGEVITYGAERCTGDGVLSISTPANGTMSFTWRDAGARGAPASATGTLTARTE